MHLSRSAEIHEFRGSLQSRPHLLQECRAFLDQHINLSATEKELVTPNFHIHVRVRSIAGFGLVSGCNSGGISMRLSRRASDIGADGHDRFHLMVPAGSRVRVAQFGRCQRIAYGSFAFVAESAPCVVETSHDVAGAVSIRFIMPREFIDHRLSVGERFCLRSYGGSESFQSLLLSTLHAFGRDAWSLTADEFLASTRAIADLVLLALEGSPDVLSGEQAVRMANLARAKRIIRNRLANPDLTPGAIAAEVGTSLSYLQKLFRDQGLSIYEYLKEERLLQAHDLLALSAPPRMSVADIFLRCGFVDKSYFSRAFKHRFGVAPSELALRR